MNGKLLTQLANCNLKSSAFDLVKGLEGGVYKKEMAAALDLFIKLPCPETAVNLVTVCPETLTIMISASDSFVRMTPEEYRGPKIQGFEKWMESFDSNLRAASDIQKFLLTEATAGRVRVGFHTMRDQSPLYHRLDQIGIRKSFMADRRQFLRDTITKKPLAFRAIIDMVCVHGVYEGRERFWNGLGSESDAQLYLQSEVLFDVSQAADAFVAVVHEVNRNRRTNNHIESDK
ncbi:MAG: hypothetical protein EWM73_03135 [Nitrospira sp.]|nr:MAG: hypothetical protein EWM73_03135 [Nitrospira sp.]